MFQSLGVWRTLGERRVGIDAELVAAVEHRSVDLQFERVVGLFAVTNNRLWITREILARSSATLASFSIIDAMIRISYGVRPSAAPLVTMSSWLPTRSIRSIIRSMTCPSLSAFDTSYVSGNNRPSSDVAPPSGSQGDV